MEKKIYKSLRDFLNKHKIDKKDANHKGIVPTHTRIGDVENYHVYGGSYSIDPEELPDFYYWYHQHVFMQKKPEYLTEKQLENGPLLVDIDFKYSYDVETRMHTEDDVNHMIVIYTDVLRKCFVFKEDQKFDVFIMEKPNVNRVAVDEITKDGIHMLIGIQVDRAMQQIIREMVLNELPEIWSELPLKNGFDDVLDSHITNRTAPWQLFGSKKPGNQAYELTMHYELTYTPNTENFAWDEKSVKDFDMKNCFYKLSAQNQKNVKFEIHPNMLSKYEERKSNKKRKRPDSLGGVVDGMEDDEEVKEIHLGEITNKEMLDKAIKYLLDKTLQPHEYKVKEIHKYTQILPEKYYQPGSHLLSRQVAFALKNMDNRLFLSWIGLRSKAEDFDYKEIPGLLKEWMSFSNASSQGYAVTFRSIIYWAKQDAYDDYIKIKEETMDYSLEEVIESPMDYDIAELLYHMYKDKYVCSDIKNKVWFQHVQHKWKKDNGYTIRRALSTEICDLFKKKIKEIENELHSPSLEPGSQRYGQLQKKHESILKITMRLKKTTEKNNIFREAMEIFYDSEFMKKLDTNPYLLGFNDGVVDLKAKIFRDGIPTDYISMSTNHNYLLTKDETYNKTVENIHKMMKTLFSNPDVLEYMWNHLSSTLIGKNINQTFTMYTGSGSNGKSILVTLMKHSVGDYFDILALPLITEKRTASGGTCSELAKLKGKRYTPTQEPSKGMRLNSGIMKEMTGGDRMQVRDLYETSSTFDPQFSPIICCNHLLEIDDCGDGTWRRIRVVAFKSKFISPGEFHTDKDAVVYLKDPELENKLPEYAPVFLNMLVERVFETQGIVKDCDAVLEASNAYRKKQDIVKNFLIENVERFEGGEIRQTSLSECYKRWYENSDYKDTKQPKQAEVFDYMNKMYGERVGNANAKKWMNVRIIIQEEEEVSRNPNEDIFF
jgi:P4 family phage/plasmid primase-like protien